MVNINSKLLVLNTHLNTNTLQDSTVVYNQTNEAPYYVSTNRNENYLNYYIFGVIVFTVIILVLLKFAKNKTQVNVTKQDQLTKQELKITELVVEGKTNNQIAEELYVSSSTIKTHINNIYRKLNITSRIELISYHKNLDNR